MRWRGVVVAMSLVAACGPGGRDSGVDAGGRAIDAAAGPDAQTCSDSWDCRAGECYDGGCICTDGRCALACAGVDGGTPCNVFASDFPPVCCEPGTQCCAVGFEWDDCTPADEPCPNVCGHGETCPADQRCVMYDPVLGGEGCYATKKGACTDACPAELQCGAIECCGENTTCNGTCCEPLMGDG